MSDQKPAAHRAGPLKQQNKSHKHGKHKSKGAVNMMNKGRVGLKAQPTRKDRNLRRMDRRNQLKQLRSVKRAGVTAAKRSLGMEGTPPHLVVCITLSSNISLDKLHALLCYASGESDSAFSSTSTLVLPVTKQRFTLVFPPPGDLYALLDVAKVADTLLFVYHAADPPDSFAELVVECCCSQGLPSTFHALQGLNEFAVKQRGNARKVVQEWISSRFPKEKAQTLESSQDAISVLRFIGGHKLRPVFCRDSHSHLIAERTEFLPGEQLGVGTLKVSGYVRSRTLSVNRLVHIVGVGDFQLLQTDYSNDPHPLKPHLQQKTILTDCMIMDKMEPEEKMEGDMGVLEIADPAKQETLDSEVIPDPMEGEQTWPTEEELRETDVSDILEKHRNFKKVPKGTSEYQAAWIISSDGDEEECKEEEDFGTGLEMESIDDSNDDVASMTGTDMDTESVAVSDGCHYDADVDVEQERRHLELIRAEKEDRLFPDEVDTPLHISARTRFAKYRGLKSFRYSSWDRKENLPLNYARIYQFQNFARTKKKLLSQKDDDGALPGWFVTLHIAAVPQSYGESINLQTRPLLVLSLLPHENKMSVLNFVLKRTTWHSQPIKSKEPLIFHCGPRRFAASPIFSQHTIGDKHKYERFFHKSSVAMATVFAPVGLPPTPVLVFQEQEERVHTLVAIGSLHSVNPDRIVCKKIVLSGHPFKIHRRSAVIRYMFFNREDINWFKPVELRTKYGCRGHIKEPLGTHGHMKCVFEKPLKAQDTVLMQLYKRVFPKWTYQPHVPLPLGWESGHSSRYQSDSCVNMKP